MQIMKNKIELLITGSTGFIGSYFINQYSSQFIVNTFSFLRDSFDTLKLDGIDCVVHCGALVHQMNEEPSYEQFFDSNVNHTLQMAIKAKASNVKQFIFISTVKVFGEESKEIFNENSPTNPKDYYGLTKKIAEEKLLKLEDKNFKVAILRLPLVFGPGVKANFRSLINIVNTFKILPLGSINNKRSMVFVGNVCHYIFQIIKLKERGIFIANEDESFSTSELIHQISKALEKNVILFSIPLLKNFLKIIKPKYYQRLFENLEVDNSLTKKILKIEKINFLVISLSRKQFLHMLNRIIALVMLIFLSPILLIVSIIILLNDGFPIFFMQKRVGIKNEHFYIIKFRTMKKDTKDIATHLVKNFENNILSSGHFLRKYSIDELPQLINILMGQMNFIGPRPALHNQYDLIKLRNKYK